MTREKAKEILISTLRDINSDDDGFEYTTEQFTEAMLIAIESLSKHSLPSNLEEAAYKYSFDSRPSIYGQVDVIDAFKAGAEYQRKQDQSLIELAEDHAMLAGMNKMKEEMMEKAMEGEVIGYDDGTGKFITVLEDLSDDSPYKVHDKVKLIVIPEEK